MYPAHNVHIVLEGFYKKFRCLWDEIYITYNFINRRPDALDCVHSDLNLETDLCMTTIWKVKLHKICSDEKKQTLRCKLYKIAFVYVNYHTPTIKLLLSK